MFEAQSPPDRGSGPVAPKPEAVVALPHGRSHDQAGQEALRVEKVVEAPSIVTSSSGRQPLRCVLIQGHSVIGSFNRQPAVKFRRDPEVEAATELLRRDGLGHELT